MKNSENYIMCDRCKRRLHVISVARCRHPAVNQHFGEHVCMYCCMKCKYHIKNYNPHSISCGYTGGDING